MSVTSNPLHISSSSSSSQLQCGIKAQPWILEAPVGQRINVSLLDFTAAILSERSSDERREPTEDVCLQYGYVIDKSAKKNVSICGRTTGRTTQREQSIYLSTSNSLQIVLTGLRQLKRDGADMNSNFDDERYNFLLKFEGWKRLFCKRNCVSSRHYNAYHLCTSCSLTICVEKIANVCKCYDSII